ncbi:MAG: FAD-binding oxidoreductase [Thermoplasmataceae archaeon]
MSAIRVLYGDRDTYGVQKSAVEEIESIFGIKWNAMIWDGKAEVPDLPDDAQLENDLSAVVGREKVSMDHAARLKHSFGLSSIEVEMLREGKYPEIVDAVVEPDKEDLPKLMAFLKSKNIRSIIYGGGTSVNGSILFRRSGKTIAISVGRLKEFRLLENIATVGSGWKGLELERKLNESGYTTGHFPESILSSTVGGWIATKAAGQESNYYGSIENRVVGASLVRSDGHLEDVLSPRESSGLMARDIALGSEGRFGLISEAAIKVDRLPVTRYYRSFIVRDFASGIHYMRNLDKIPALVRMSDAAETEFSFKNTAESFGLRYVRRRISGKGFREPCLMIMIDNDQNRITRPENSISLGRFPAVTWERDRYERPYLGNELWKRGIVPDTLETSALWTNMLELHRSTVEIFEKMRKEREIRGFIMSHISHLYKQGACVYFTFAIRSDNVLEDISALRDAMLENFISHGSPVTHHHSPGTLMRKFENREKLNMQSKFIDPLFAGGDIY